MAPSVDLVLEITLIEARAIECAPTSFLVEPFLRENILRSRIEGSLTLGLFSLVRNLKANRVPLIIAISN